MIFNYGSNLSFLDKTASELLDLLGSLDDFELKEKCYLAGVNKYPDLLDSFGHPIFIKEYVRFLLALGLFQKAEAIVKNLPSFDRWFDILFARAYLKSNDFDQALVFFEKTNIYYPSVRNEYENFCASNNINLLPSIVQDCRESVVDDCEVAKTFVIHGANDPTNTIARFFNNSVVASIDKAKDVLSDLIDETKNKILSDDDQDIQIPKISHRIWLTNPQSPCSPPVEQIRKIIEYNKNFGPGWRHFFWVQNFEFINYEIRMLLNSQDSIELKIISENLTNDHTLKIISSYVQENKFAFACDICRMKCLDEYGGIYMDIGINFTVKVDEFIGKFDYLLLFWHKFFFQNGMLGSKPKSALTSIYLHLVNNPNCFPRYLFDKNLHGGSDLALISGPSITVLIFLLFPKNLNAGIFVANRRALLVSSHQSWYAGTGNSGKFGSALVHTSKPTIAEDKIWENSEPVFFVNSLQSRV
jgi:hypothetical protein